jgi:hypothetical protein
MSQAWSKTKVKDLVSKVRQLRKENPELYRYFWDEIIGLGEDNKENLF